MIKSDAFYAAFEAGFNETLPPGLLQRRRGKIPKYTASLPADTLNLWFKVNPKASAIPHQPGEFWPALDMAALRHGLHDFGTVSWYQCTTAEMQSAIEDMNRRVHARVMAQTAFENDVWRQMRDVWGSVAATGLDIPLRAGTPHVGLMYLEAEDAAAWGRLFGGQMEDWLRAFRDQPETLDMHMWRVYWGPNASPPAEPAAH